MPRPLSFRLEEATQVLNNTIFGILFDRRQLLLDGAFNSVFRLSLPSLLYNITFVFCQIMTFIIPCSY